MHLWTIDSSVNQLDSDQLLYLSWLFRGKVCVGVELYDPFVARFVILNEQLAVVVDPKLSNDDVVHGSRHLLIGVVIARLNEVYVNVADRNDAKSTNM